MQLRQKIISISILLLLQSLSSFILKYFESLLKDHFMITLFLTTLIGAGGNVGNQSAVQGNKMV